MAHGPEAAGPAELARGDAAPGFRVAGVVAPLEADLQRHAGTRFTAARARSVEATSSATGFSQKIAFPARAAASIKLACAPVGVTIDDGLHLAVEIARSGSATARAP